MSQLGKHLSELHIVRSLLFSVKVSLLMKLWCSHGGVLECEGDPLLPV